MELARLPVSEGGLGLTACNSIRRAAYAASRQTIFERHNSFSAQIVNRNAVRASEEIRNSTDTNEASERSQKLSHIARSTTFKGNYDWLQSTAKLVPSHLFRLAVLPRLGMPLQSSMKEIRCPGCQAELNQHSVLTHLPGCTQCKGINASFKHNTLVRYIHKMCLNAGIPCEKEPRRFSSVHCTTCRAPITEETSYNHSKVCAGRQTHRNGPDLVIHWQSGEIYYDLTVIHELAPSRIQQKCGRLINEAIKRKQATYVASGLIPALSFQCLPVLSGGSLHKNLKNLLDTLAIMRR